MAVIQITRAEYQKKYGTPAPGTSSKIDTTPAPIQMTRAEYALKYGQPPPGSQPPQEGIGSDIQAAGADVNAAIIGTGQYQGQSALRRGFSAASSAAMAVPTVAADIVPGGKTALKAVSTGINAATDFAGHIGNYLADVAVKVGVMSPEERKKYDANNAQFAHSPVGQAIESATSVANSAGNIANVILMADGFAKTTHNIVTNQIPKIANKLATTSPIPEGSPAAHQQSLIRNVAN